MPESGCGWILKEEGPSHSKSLCRGDTAFEDGRWLGCVSRRLSKSPPQGKRCKLLQVGVDTLATYVST